MSNALDTYITKIAEASTLLEDLTDFVDNHGDVSPDNVTWSDVGNINRLIELLKEAHNFVNPSR